MKSQSKGPEKEAVFKKDRSAQRMARMFQRRQEAGLVRLQVWVLAAEQSGAEDTLKPFTERAAKALAASGPADKEI